MPGIGFRQAYHPGHHPDHGDDFGKPVHHGEDQRREQQRQKRQHQHADGQHPQSAQADDRLPGVEADVGVRALHEQDQDPGERTGKVSERRGEVRIEAGRRRPIAR
jgi:hypothetical protein